MSELRAVAERLAKPNYGSDIGKLWADTTLLVRHVLATVREDDGEAVDEAWLRSVGWKPDGVHIVLRDWGRNRNCTCQIYDGKTWYINGDEINAPSTRGDVRALCQALNIPLQETR